jgi:molecular chaperone GrpE
VENEKENEEYNDAGACDDLSADSEHDIASKLKAAEADAAHNLNQYLKTLAEFDNFRKRMIKERASASDDGSVRVITNLLPVIDNFERAVLFCAADEKNTQLYAGVEMIYKQLTETLRDMGVEPIKAAGETFNPDIHSAILHIEDDSYGDGEIIEDLQKGYMYKDKVLRYSMVKVAN